MTNPGWRACIDHIIRPDSLCPVCELEAKDKEIKRLQLILKADEEEIALADTRIAELEAKNRELHAEIADLALALAGECE